MPKKFIAVVWHKVGRTMAAQKVMLTHFALQEAAG
jgi:hypothetical protein